MYPQSLAPSASEVCVKPWLETCGVAAERMVLSTWVKGPGGDGWSWE